MRILTMQGSNGGMVAEKGKGTAAMRQQVNASQTQRAGLRQCIKWKRGDRKMAACLNIRQSNTTQRWLLAFARWHWVGPTPAQIRLRIAARR